MISISITTDAADTRKFLVRIEGELKRPRALNDALGRRLARELQGHFRARNPEPNKMRAPKTDFWKQVADATVMTEATDTGATVTIAESRFRIHLFGGTIKPTGGRKFLTIPLIKEARGKRVSQYEAESGRKLFRLPGRKVLMERTESGTSSFTGRQVATVQRNGIYKKVSLRARSQVRGVYVLKESVTLKADPRALPDTEKLLAALTDTAGKWADRENLKA